MRVEDGRAFGRFIRGKIVGGDCKRGVERSVVKL